MPRKVEKVVIEAEGRDQGKTFVITEMPATLGKKWIMKLYSRAAEAEAESKTANMLALMDQPELEEWRNCVKFQPANPKLLPMAIFWDKDSMQIEEIATVGFLQGKVLEMHTSFFPVESP